MQEKAAETKDGNAVPKALAYKDGVTYKEQRRPVSAGASDPMNKVKSSKGPKVEQAFFFTGPNKSDVGMYAVVFGVSIGCCSNLFKPSINAYSSVKLEFKVPCIDQPSYTSISIIIYQVAFL